MNVVFYFPNRNIFSLRSLITPLGFCHFRIKLSLVFVKTFYIKNVLDNMLSIYKKKFQKKFLSLFITFFSKIIFWQTMLSFKWKSGKEQLGPCKLRHERTRYVYVKWTIWPHFIRLKVLVKVPSLQSPNSWEDGLYKTISFYWLAQFYLIK